MAWKDDNLNNTVPAVGVLATIATKLFQAAKGFHGLFTQGSPPTADDVGIVRWNNARTGREYWTGTEWTPITYDLAHGGTGVNTLAGLKQLIGATSGDGAGSVVGERLFSRNLTVRASLNGNNQIIQPGYESFQIRVSNQNWPSGLESVGSYYEGVTAFRVIRDGNEVAAGFISSITRTGTTSEFECTTFFGADITNYAGSPNFGSTGNTVTLELWRRAIVGILPSTAWADVTGKPAIFPPSAHTHLVGHVIGLGALAIEDSVTDAQVSGVLGRSKLATGVPTENEEEYFVSADGTYRRPFPNTRDFLISNLPHNLINLGHDSGIGVVIVTNSKPKIRVMGSTGDNQGNLAARYAYWHRYEDGGTPFSTDDRFLIWSGGSYQVGTEINGVSGNLDPGIYVVYIDQGWPLYVFAVSP